MAPLGGGGSGLSVHASLCSGPPRSQAWGAGGRRSPCSVFIVFVRVTFSVPGVERRVVLWSFAAGRVNSLGRLSRKTLSRRWPPRRQSPGWSGKPRILSPASCRDTPPISASCCCCCCRRCPRRRLTRLPIFRAPRTLLGHVSPSVSSLEEVLPCPREIHVALAPVWPCGVLRLGLHDGDGCWRDRPSCEVALSAVAPGWQ